MLCLVETQHQDQLKEKSRSARKQKRKTPCCTKCGEPMKGHQKKHVSIKYGWSTTKCLVINENIHMHV